jgi:hypothetical protein
MQSMLQAGSKIKKARQIIEFVGLVLLLAPLVLGFL